MACYFCFLFHLSARVNLHQEIIDYQFQISCDCVIVLGFRSCFLWFVVFIRLIYQKFFLIKSTTCCNLYRSLFSRKRTSIAAPEKRSLEAYFAVQPRPSGEKIAAIAEKLDLKKNVVRVWFCNQRQKQKRMKFAAQHWPTNSQSSSSNSSQNVTSVAAIARQLSIGMNPTISNNANNMNNNSGNNGAAMNGSNTIIGTNTINSLLNVNGTHLSNGHVTNAGFGYSV